MGVTTSMLLEKLIEKNRLKVLMLGLDGAGKTTMFYKIKPSDRAPNFSSIVNYVETIKYEHFELISWDIGGNDRIMTLYRHHYKDSKALIFVVDSSDREGIALVKDELHKLLKEEELKDAILLILANKQDLGVMSIEEVSEKLELKTLQGKVWNIQGTCAITSDGLLEGLEWVKENVMKKNKLVRFLYSHQK